MNNSNNRSNWKFFIGAGLGLAAGLYANSRKGREQRAQAAEFIDEQTSTLLEKSENYISQANAMLNTVRERGTEYLAKAKAEANQSKDEISNYVDSEMANLESKVNRKARTVKNNVNA